MHEHAAASFGELKARHVLLLAIVVATSGVLASWFALFASSSPSPSAPTPKNDKPIIHDDGLKVELVSQGLQNPTSMRFLPDGNILVLEKNDGQARLVSTSENETNALKAKPVLVVNDTATGAEQ